MVNQKQIKQTRRQGEKGDKINIEEMNIEELPILNVGLIGHIDHGKTTLLYQLTGKWADTHSEELKRGITIKLGYADALIRKSGQDYGIKEGEPVRYVSFVDVPGHEMLMATMLSGAAIMDAAILVIAANEGIKPQTREHLIALQARRVNQIIIVQNKIDLVSREDALRNFREIKDFVKGTVAEDAPIIPVSAQQGVNMDKVYDVLCQLEIPERDLSSDPLFVVARSFDVNNPGSKISDLKGGVLGGALKRGRFKIGNEIEIKPGLSLVKGNQQIYETIKTRIVSMFRGKHPVNEACPGGSLAIETELDPNLTKADSLSGCVVGMQGRLPDIVDRIKIRFKLFKEVLGMHDKKNVDPIKTNELLLLGINTSITIGRVRSLKNNEIELSLKIPIVPFKKENVGIARNIDGHWRLVGFGELDAISC